MNDLKITDEGVQQEIDGGKNIEEELQGSEGEYRRFFEYSNDIILQVDRFGKVININNKLIEMLGFTPEEVIGKYFFNLGILGIRDLPMIVNLFKETVCKGMTRDKAGRLLDKLELELRNKNGNLIFVEASTTVLKKEGKIDGFLTSVRDITESKQAKEKLKASEKKYSTLVEKGNDGIIILQDNVLKFVNSIICKMTGFTKEESIGKPFLNYIAPEYKKIVQERYEKRLRGDAIPSIYEIEIVSKDGLKTPVEINASCVEYEGRPASMAIIRDATKRKLADERIKQSEEKYRDLFQNANDAICILDSDLKYKDVNNKTVEMFGYTRDELLKMRVHDLIPTEQIPISEIKFNELRKKGSYEKFVGKARTKDGRLIDVEVSSSVIKDGGKIIGSRDIIRDITERKRYEADLKAAQKSFEDVLNSIDSLIYAADMKTYEILFINKFGRDNWGEIQGKICWQTLQKGQSGPCKFCTNKWLICPDGKPSETIIWDFQNTYTNCWYECRDKAIYWPDGRLVRIEIATDITERKEAQEQIEKSLKEKEVLVREVYHRVKNNMQIITSLLNLQSRYIRDKEYREMFKESHDRIKSMSLVHEKLYQSKDLTTIDLKEYIKDISKYLFHSYGANEGKIELVVDINKISLDINTAIPCGLIINELVTNSLKHAFPGGKKGEIKIYIQSMNENMIELVVGDNGIGMPGDMDFRTTKSLGLQLVTMLAENQLNGSINLNLNKGTEFTITFKEVR
jgi:PAS domain S-box-containing protein